MCVGPVSPETMTPAPRASATTSATHVWGERKAPPPAVATTSCARSYSPGPQSTTDFRFRRARSAMASAPSLGGGQRLLGHAAPGLSSTYEPPAASVIEAATAE